MSFRVPPPEIPDETLERNGWTATSEDKSSLSKSVFGSLEVEAFMYTKKYEYGYDVEERKKDEDTKLLFANRTRMEPGLEDLPFGVGEERVMGLVKTFARDRFKDEFRDRGMRELEAVGEDVTEAETGEEIDLEEITATYSKEASSGIQDVSVSGWIGVWYHDGDVFTAGGVYPAEGKGGKDEEEVLDLIRAVR